MFNRLWKILTSLRLTAVLLALSILLVFVGTVAQADEGLYTAQARYFKHWFVFGISFFGHRLPVPLPGGYLLGTALLINLVAAHIQRFQWTWKKIGIHLAHTGIILLLVGQLVTDLFSRETQLQFFEGETKNYSESGRAYELAFVTDVDEHSEEVVAFPEASLTAGAEIRHEKLPFTVRVKEIWRNSEPAFRAPMQEHAPPLATNGIAQHFDFRAVPAAKTMDEKNVPTAVLEITGPEGSPGDWVVSGWAGDAALVSAIRSSYARQMKSAQMGDAIANRLSQPQTVEAGGRVFSLTLRPVRAYKPFSLTLLKATHMTYPGRPDIPKDFRSRVRLQNPQTGENRELEIYMNTPLRYGGLTFYQYQMAAGETAQQAGATPSSTLQVVRNPGWLTPYAGCVIVAAGLTFQFMFHLVGFLSKRRAA
jgi:hypothetical protein